MKGSRAYPKPGQYLTWYKYGKYIRETIWWPVKDAPHIENTLPEIILSIISKK